MAKGRAECTCKTCGAKFFKEKDCYNRAEADQFETWARNNCEECPTCYRERIVENSKHAAEPVKNKYNLPEITGVSEKQIQYATTLRDRFCAKSEQNFELVNKFIGQANRTKLAAIMERENLSESEVFSRAISANMGAVSQIVYKLLNMSAASEIIDLLKNH